MSEFRGTPGPYIVGYGEGVTGPAAAWQFGLSAATEAIRDQAQAKTILVSAPQAFTDRHAGAVVALTCDEANAHLLAASWEMFEALRELAAIFLDEQLREFVFGLDHDISLAARVELAHRAARAAIAKALGEQP